MAKIFLMMWLPVVLFFLLVTPGQAKPLQVLVGMHKPPYIQVDSNDGYEVELLRQIIKGMGRTAAFTYVPNKRLLTLLQQGIGDIATLQGMSAEQPGLHYSCPYISYQNVAITLAQHQLSLNRIDDLAGLSVLAFQNAAVVLPESYRRVAAAAADYRETTDQRTQVDMLLKQRVQVIVMDMNIFHYYQQQQEIQLLTQVHPLFAPTIYRAAFRDAALAERFNQSWRRFSQQQDLQLLRQRYFARPQAELPAECLAALTAE